MSKTELSTNIISWLGEKGKRPKVCVFDVESTAKYAGAGDTLVYNLAFDSFQVGRVKKNISSTHDYINLDVVSSPRILSTIKDWSQIKNAKKNSLYYLSIGFLFDSKNTRVKDLQAYYAPESVKTLQSQFKQKVWNDLDSKSSFSKTQVERALKYMQNNYFLKKEASSNSDNKDIWTKRRKKIEEILEEIAKDSFNYEYKLNMLNNWQYSNEIERVSGYFTSSDITKFQKKLKSYNKETSSEEYKNNYMNILQSTSGKDNNLTVLLQEHFKKNAKVKTWKEISKIFTDYVTNESKGITFVTSYNFSADRSFIERTNTFSGIEGINFEHIKNKCSYQLFKSITESIKKDGTTFYKIIDGNKELIQLLNKTTKEELPNLSLDTFFQICGDQGLLQSKITRHTALDDTQLLMNALSRYLKANLTIDQKKK